MLDRLIMTVSIFEPEHQRHIFGKTRESVDGIREFVQAGDADGNVRMRSLQQLHSHCYTFAGLVGVMLSEMFMEAHPRLADDSTLSTKQR